MLDSRNLYDKLKPEIAAAINADLEFYPYLVGSLIQALSTTIAVTELKYGLIISLESYYYRVYKEKCQRPWDAFVDD